jgi:uncharacterized protein YbaR (Trm112 family)
VICPDLLSILVCPACRKALIEKDETLRCESCGENFPVLDGIPVFLREPAEIVSAAHESNALGAEFEEILERGAGLTLHLGAGASARRHPNCIEFEHKIFRHTDVVGDAHHLPFRDNVFDRVFAFNVFEHLREPLRAAREIHRVLKPGGALALHTAFLQPLHEAPHHYYNATEFGVREWFRDFEIEQCEVSGNFAPGFMLGFLSASLLDALAQSDLPTTEQAQIAASSVGQWAEFWRTKTETPPGFVALLTLPPELQKRVAAGFELRAHKRTDAR